MDLDTPLFSTEEAFIAGLRPADPPHPLVKELLTRVTASEEWADILSRCLTPGDNSVRHICVAVEAKPATAKLNIDGPLVGDCFALRQRFKRALGTASGEVINPIAQTTATHDDDPDDDLSDDAFSKFTTFDLGPDLLEAIKKLKVRPAAIADAVYSWRGVAKMAASRSLLEQCIEKRWPSE